MEAEEASGFLRGSICLLEVYTQTCLGFLFFANGCHTAKLYMSQDEEKKAIAVQYLMVYLERDPVPSGSIACTYLGR